MNFTASHKKANSGANNSTPVARPPSISGLQWGSYVWNALPGGSDRNWKSEAGRLLDNSAISILLGTVCNNFSDAPLCVRRFNPQNSTYEVVPTHPLAALLKRPNAYWTRTQLFRAVLTSLYLDGNAYIFKARNSLGTVVELWWLPHQTVTVICDESGFVTGYRYQVRGAVTIYAPEDVIHLKIGVNPERPELGEAPLRAVLREACVDNEVMNYTYSILKNVGVPGVILSPKVVKTDEGDTIPEVTQGLRDKVKMLWRKLTTGDARGEPLIMNMPWDVSVPGFKPSELLLDKVGRLSEVRIAGAFGVPVVVVQFLSGLENVNAKASYEQSIQQLYGCCLIPLQRLVCEWLDLQLLSELGDPSTEHCWFDRSEVAALQENANDLWKRANVGFVSGFLKRGEARKIVGFDDGPEDDVYIFDLKASPGPDVTEDETKEDEDLTDPESQKAAMLKIAKRWRERGHEAPEVEALS